MSVNFLHPRTAAAAPRSGQEEPQQPGTYVIDWHAVQQTEHSCCCTARPAVIAIMPPNADRPHHTELLLCGHHYRVSQQVLRAAGATLLDIKGAPVAGGTRPPARIGV
jgi:hypothetical protein